MSSPLVVFLDGKLRYHRAAVLKSRGYNVFTTGHVVEVCLRWILGDCAALVIGPQIPWREVATLCEWVKANYPNRPILLLGERPLGRVPDYVEVVAPSQLARVLLKRLRIVSPLAGGQAQRLPLALATDGALGASVVDVRAPAKR